MADARGITCKLGCHACCFQVIPCTSAEADKIVAGLSTTAKARLKRKCIEASTRWMRLTVRLLKAGTPITIMNLWRSGGVPCPLLIGGLCSRYADRPLACCGYVSYGPPGDCERARNGQRISLATAATAVHGVEPDLHLCDAILAAMDYRP